jgi:hypothetical protein
LPEIEFGGHRINVVGHPARVLDLLLPPQDIIHGLRVISMVCG